MAFRKGGKKSFYKKKEEKAEDHTKEEEEEDNSEDAGSDSEDKTPTKKQKTSNSTSNTTTTKKSSSSSSSSNDKSIDLGNKRKIQFSTFGGSSKIDIREFYEDKNSKELKPGTKGISLTFEQFQIIADNIDTILSWTK
ncbi:hypothetical protein DICPUDRAFT_27270 [Dictyostelium purpureum]|uniref:Transcriptional coactivator p15 (PC4) C-terminal domain-containing protein n=1 Tax=Dictyostelium purpureum TaxID=5786 RepID=F0Z9T3_DICPU|nr:uncharacterized protein DICPUDRAFT_27270 [Dictyostelium purpureum]EGC39267.1 hypothetical protein DICPUDRAFT_27270 [Dictyostelium purpureum]|eukprot:XP_003284171.1 hypothetical protein DICPUDRAFT_27270 [Dictyostelium purpureum]